MMFGRYLWRERLDVMYPMLGIIVYVQLAFLSDRFSAHGVGMTGLSKKRYFCPCGNTLMNLVYVDCCNANLVGRQLRIRSATPEE